jgi:hypothetical protein
VTVIAAAIAILNRWQTLAVGNLAVAAAVLTVWATIRSANRETLVAQQQTATAQQQIETTLCLERRRTPREAYAFSWSQRRQWVSSSATLRRYGKFSNRIRPGLRNRHMRRDKGFRNGPSRSFANLRLGGQLTAPFLSLDNRIAIFAAQSYPAQDPGGRQYPVGRNAGLVEERAEMTSGGKSRRFEGWDSRRWNDP